MLKDIVEVVETIPIGKDNSFDVRGLTLEDLGSLIKDYKTPLGEMMENKINVNTIADTYPEFMAKVIAIAAGEPDEWEKVKGLPFSIQLFAFENVWDLTIPDYKALGKLIERIKGIIQPLQGNKE